MAVNEQIITGRKFRKLIDEASRLWLRISFWTKASDVEFDDGEDAEKKFVNMQAVIENLKQTFQNFKDFVLDALGGCKIEQEGDNFYIVGADAVRKKLGSISSDDIVEIKLPYINGNTQTIDTYPGYTADDDYVAIAAVVAYAYHGADRWNYIRTIAEYDKNGTFVRKLISSTASVLNDNFGMDTGKPGYAIVNIKKGYTYKLINDSGLSSLAPAVGKLFLLK